MRTFIRSLVKSKTSFQILSDLHLEVGNAYSTIDVPAEAPYLILAGDIGRLVDLADYAKFLERQIDRFDLIFLVLGNHEFLRTLSCRRAEASGGASGKGVIKMKGGTA